MILLPIIHIINIINIYAITTTKVPQTLQFKLLFLQITLDIGFKIIDIKKPIKNGIKNGIIYFNSKKAIKIIAEMYGKDYTFAARCVVVSTVVSLVSVPILTLLF